MNDTALKIEKGIPLPEARGGPRAKSQLDPMEVGDSVFFPGRAAPAVATSVGTYGKRHGRKFTVRTVTEGGVTGTRAWRVV